jgi:hypothetical protein
VKYDADLLAAALVERLRPHIPPDVSLRPERGGVTVLVEGFAWLRQGVKEILNPPGDQAALLEIAVWNVLSKVQDFVSEHRAEPWPRWERGGDPLPSPRVAVRSGALHLWFGNEDEPVLRLEPIRLNDLQASGRQSPLA